MAPTSSTGSDAGSKSKNAAAAKAAFQLVCTPFYWEKTSHGLNEDAGQTHAEQAA